MFLSLFFALAIGFSLSIEASAHTYTDSAGNEYTHSEDINVGAADVGIADDAQMKKFVLHIATHLDLINDEAIYVGMDRTIQNPEGKLDEAGNREASREITIFANKALQRAGEGEDPEVFNHGDVYIITTLDNLKGAIASHGLYPNLYGRKYNTSEDPLKTLLGDTVPVFSDNVDPVCVRYDGGNRVACAVTLIPKVPSGPVKIIAGLHHAEDPSFLQVLDCSGFTPPVTAKELEDETDPAMKKELLKRFVKGVIQITSKIFADTANDPDVPLTNLGQESVARFFDKAPCFREPDLRYGSIYAFIMDPIEGVAFLSGNDFSRNGLSVSLDDPNPVLYDGTHEEPNVLTAIHRVLTETPPPDPIPTKPNPITMREGVDVEHGDSGFFRYHWAHPINTELNTPDYLERGETPGRALKESYIEAVNVYANAENPILSRFPLFFVFGSGIYLEEDDMMPPGDDMVAEDDDDGCAIAATDNTPQSALLNLLLTASVLFSAVFLRKRV